MTTSENGNTYADRPGNDRLPSGLSVARHVRNLATTDGVRRLRHRTGHTMGKSRLRAVILSIFFLANTQAAFASDVLGACKPDALSASNKIDLSRYAGKFIYVDFWASWCPPCLASFPFMDEMHQKYEGDGLVVLAVSVDEEKKDAQQFVARTKPTFVTGIDTTGVCPKTFNVKAMPSSYLIDPNGNVVMTHLGFRKTDVDKIEANIKAHITR